MLTVEKVVTLHNLGEQVSPTLTVYRSAREATGAVLSETQVLSGDFVKVGGPAPAAAGVEVFGRIVADDDPALQGKRPTPGKVMVKMADGSVQEFSPTDLEKQQAMDVPPESVRTLSTSEDDQMMNEVMADMQRRRVKRPRSDDPFKDKERSMTQRLAQKHPVTRLKKSDKMKKHWRGVQNRASYQGGGLAQESLDEQGLNAPQSEHDFDPNDEEDLTSDDHFGTQPVQMASEEVIDSEEAWMLTQRTFELADDMIRSLSIHKGMVYFESMEDNAEDGTVTIVLNGMAPREIIDQFMSDSEEEIDVQLIEEPEGTMEDKDLRGRWVVQSRVVLPEEEFEEEDELDDDNEAYNTRGKYPGEVDVEAGLGGGAVAPQEA